MWELPSIQLISALFQQQAERDIVYENLETVKHRKDQHQLKPPSSLHQTVDSYHEWCKEYMRTYVPPKGKVCTHFTTNFCRYAPPTAHLITEEEAIKRYCPFEPTGAYSVVTPVLAWMPTNKNTI